MNKILKLFNSFGGINTKTLSQTNIYKMNGAGGRSYRNNNELESVSPSCDNYLDLIESQERLVDYRNHDLTETILDLYFDAVFSNIEQSTSKYINIVDKDKETEKINAALDQLDIINFLKSHFKDLVYYGSFTSELIYNAGSKEFKVKELINPYDSIKFKDSGKYIIRGLSSFKTLDEVLRLSLNDLELDIPSETLEGVNIVPQEDEFYVKDRGVTGRPLFLSVELKVKEYILKDLILSYLGLMKVIEQDTYVLDVQRLSDMDSVVEVCERVKDMIVTKDDVNLLTAARLDKSALVKRLFDNTRVIPNVSNNLSSLQELQGTKLDDKISTLQNNKETLRDEILTSIGFPRDLFAGSTNKWEVGRQADRYNLKVSNYKAAVTNSTIDIVMTISRMLNLKVNRKDITVPFIRSSNSEVTNLSQRIEVNSSSIRLLSEIIESVNNVLKPDNNNPALNQNKIYDLIKSILDGIDPELSVSLTEGKITKDNKSGVTDTERANRNIRSSPGIITQPR